MVEVEKHIAKTEKTLDNWFGKLQKQIGATIKTFVASMFFLIAIGAWLGITVYHYWPNQAMMAVLLPALAGAIAYYNRSVAVIIFIGLIVLVFL
jgi:ABC-type methionine transport system permease subunit